MHHHAVARIGNCNPCRSLDSHRAASPARVDVHRIDADVPGGDCKTDTTNWYYSWRVVYSQQRAIAPYQEHHVRIAIDKAALRERRIAKQCLQLCNRQISRRTNASTQRTTLERRVWHC